jgi:prophage regulatory protein
MTKIIRIEQVVERTGVSKMTIYRWINSGEFPRQRKLSRHGVAVGWLDTEVDAWINSRQRAA